MPTTVSKRSGIQVVKDILGCSAKSRDDAREKESCFWLARVDDWVAIVVRCMTEPEVRRDRPQKL